MSVHFNMPYMVKPRTEYECALKIIVLRRNLSCCYIIFVLFKCYFPKNTSPSQKRDCVY